MKIIENKINVSIIVAHSNSGGIGINGTIPWKIKKDMAYFKDITSNVFNEDGLVDNIKNDNEKKFCKKNAVIMGRKTYQSIPEKFRPLDNRYNLVLSSTEPTDLTEKEMEEHLHIDLHYNKSYKELYDSIVEHKDVINDLFVIGGGKIYNDFLYDETVKELFNVDMIYVTRIRKKYECDAFFPKIPSNYFIQEYTPDFEENGNKFYFIKYKKEDKKHEEYNYLDMVQGVLDKHTYKLDRTGEGILTQFGCSSRYNICDTFPLLTTKRVFWKGIVEELLWFLSGDTNVQHLIDKGVHIWDKNSDRAFLDSLGMKDRKEFDGGPIYGFNFRHFGAKYIDCDTDYTGQGTDQVAEVLRLIREEPQSRRILINLWNPCELKNVCLPACHCLYQFYVEGDYLSCSMYQRSGDLGLGVPFNIASASLMTYMFAHLTNKIPKELIHTIGDAHIYKNHVDAVKEQLKRKPTPFPRVRIEDRGQKCVEDFKYEDFIVSGYEPHPSIKMDMAV